MDDNAFFEKLTLQEFSTYPFKTLLVFSRHIVDVYDVHVDVHIVDVHENIFELFAACSNLDTVYYT